MAPRGGARPGAGRKPGDPARLATKSQKASLGERAQKYTDVALSTLARIARKSESDSASVAAANALLDRGYGRPRQEVTGAGGGPIAYLDLSKLSDAQLAALEPVLSALAASGAPAGASTH